MTFENRIKPERRVPPAEICARINVTRATLWRWQKLGIFPAFRQFGPNTAGILESEFDEWLAARPTSNEAA